MEHTGESVADRIAMLAGGGLIAFGLVVLGLVNALTNNPHVTLMEEGEVVAEPLVPPDLRAYLIALGLLIWAVYAVYTLLQPAEPAEETAATPAD